MFIKMQPEELNRRPLITAENPEGDDPEVYMGRVIVEFWRNAEGEGGEPAFAWSVDDPEQLDEEWVAGMLSALRGATRHIEDVYSRHFTDSHEAPQ